MNPFKKKGKPCYHGLMKNQRGSFAYFWSFLIIAVILGFLFAVTIPVSMNVTTKFYAIGESQIDKALETTNGIQDANVKAALLETLTDAKDSTETSVEAQSFLYQYGWVLVMFLLAFSWFIIARKTTEFEQQVV